jgi:glycine/D-amino acid oxidase-like deaminating enzyme
MNLHDGTPFWPRRDGILALHPPVSNDLGCDVLVVGAGITGSLIGLELTRRGLGVVVVDRRDAGGGSTSASTALLQYEIDELLTDLARTIGWDDAATAYQECNRAIDLIEQATQTVGHNCGFRRSPSIFTATRKSDIAVLHSEYEARCRAGFDVTWLDQSDLRTRWE